MIARHVTPCDFTCNLCRNKILREVAGKVAKCKSTMCYAVFTFICLYHYHVLIYPILCQISKFLKKYRSNQLPKETALSIPLTTAVNRPITSVQQENTQVDMTARGTGSATEHNDQSQNPVGSIPPIIDKVNNNGELEGEHELNELLCAPNDEYTTNSV